MPENTDHRPTILIIGATGRTGHLLATRLDRRGYAVRALCRDPAAARDRLPAGVEIVAGELGDAAQVSSAVAGADAVVFTASAGGLVRGRPRDIDFGGVSRVVDAAKHAGVGHMVLVASAAVTHPEHPHNCTFNSVLKWKLRGENHLRASGVPYTIVRPLGLRDRDCGLQGVRILQGDRLAFGEDIAREDVAAFLADVVSVGTPLGGAALAEPLSFAPDLDAGSLIGSTIEIYNDGSLPGGTWSSSKRAFTTDAMIPGAGRYNYG